MEVITIYFSYIKKTIFCLFDYKTCSGRREYFYFYLFVAFCSIFAGIIIGFIMEFIDILGEVILSFFLILVFVFSLPLCIRRLNDIGKNPWFILIGLIPIGGPITLLIFFCKISKENDKFKESKKNSLYPRDKSNNSIN